jgi:probable phosphoglycerate mutase
MTDRIIYLLRHGETHWNKENRFQGCMNSPLTENGMSQASKMGECLARQLNGEGYSMISSPLGRTRQTAEIVCSVLNHDFNKCTYDDQLREVTLGQWDGLTRQEVGEQFPSEWALYNQDKWHQIPPDGESSAMMEIRAQKWFASRSESLAPLVVVSHGAFGRVIRGVYGNLGIEDTLSLSVPQDAIFRLSGGLIDEIHVDD